MIRYARQKPTDVIEWMTGLSGSHYVVVCSNGY